MRPAVDLRVRIAVGLPIFTERSSCCRSIEFRRRIACRLCHRATFPSEGPHASPDLAIVEAGGAAVASGLGRSGGEFRSRVPFAPLAAFAPSPFAPSPFALAPPRPLAPSPPSRPSPPRSLVSSSLPPLRSRPRLVVRGWFRCGVVSGGFGRRGWSSGRCRWVGRWGGGWVTSASGGGG